ncbi:MAG: hypothetical protein GDA51_00300 [Ekhidna sp.]|nr:hypothetical protein [Ekhidna sp.]
MKIPLTLTCPPCKNTNVVKNGKKLKSKIIYASLLPPVYRRPCFEL